MAIVDDLLDVAANGDQVAAAWVNAVSQQAGTNATNITANAGSITALQALRDELKLTAGSGLSVNYLGGRLLMPNGTYITVAPGSLAVPASSTVTVFVNGAGVVAQGLIVPPAAWHLARVTTSASAVTTIDVAPTRYLLDRPIKIVQAVKSTITPLPADGVSYGIPGWNVIKNEGGVMNGGSGVITIPSTHRIRVEASALVYSSGATSLDGKLALFNGTTEMKTLDWLRVPAPASAPSVMMLQGFYETREDQDIGGVGGFASLTLQILFKTGTSSNIQADNNTMIQVWRTS